MRKWEAQQFVVLLSSSSFYKFKTQLFELHFTWLTLIIISSVLVLGSSHLWKINILGNITPFTEYLKSREKLIKSTCVIQQLHMSLGSSEQTTVSIYWG